MIIFECNPTGFELPSDFLSFGMEGEMGGGGNMMMGYQPDEETQRQIEEDERLARMLADELFLDELRNNQEFVGMLGGGASALGNNNNTSNGTVHNGRFMGFGGSRSQENTATSQGGMTDIDDDSDGMSDFKRKLNNMSEAAKKKFNELAAVFSNNDDEQPPGANRYATLPGDEDDDDTEFIAFGAGQNLQHRKKQSTSLLDNENPSDSLDFEDDEADTEFVGGLADRRFEMTDFSSTKTTYTDDSDGDDDDNDDELFSSLRSKTGVSSSKLGTGGTGEMLNLGPTLNSKKNE
eukprot:TRINITY_DN147_c1_g1_i1.p1 TRINITY_DN147_c1_g1~~TRINITY_DN147_c1_g1_i1.p1  ORF type:complete len:293 (-),score=123.77 TRINITY_DN147_c1_g1_i1:4-882(-)